MEKNNKGKNEVNNTSRYIVIFSLLIVLLVGIALVKKGMTKDPSEAIKPVYSYKVNKDSDYVVTLKDNQYYQNKQLPAGTQYVSEAVSEYGIDLKYYFDGNQDAKIQYTYTITAELVGIADKTTNNIEASSNKSVWTRNYTLQGAKTNSIDGKDFNLNEHVIINYPSYDQLVRSFEQAYGINLNAILKVKLNVNYNMELPNGEVKQVKDNVEVDIQLAETTTELTENYIKEENKNFLPNIKEELKTDFSFGYIAIGSTLIVISSVAAALLYATKQRSAEQLYKKNMNSILKEYSDLIVTVTNKPDLRGLKTMQLAILADLVDVAEQKQSNIVLYEKVKNEQCDLYVISDSYVYTYTVTYEELK